MENQLLTLLQRTRDEGDESARAELNELLRKDPDARKIMATLLVDEQALIGHLRDESIISLLEPSANEKEITTSLPQNRPGFLPIGMAVAAGLAIGLICMSVAFGYAQPRTTVSLLKIKDGDFDSLPLGPIERKFSSSFGKWSGDPIEVVEGANGNQRLRFVETGNVKNNPNAGASASNAFQFIDLTNLRHQWQDNDRNAQQTLELSVYFDRASSPEGEDLPKVRAGCKIYLFDTAPENIVSGWPHILTDVIAVGKKTVKLQPGEKSGEIVASCLLEPEATIALITIDVGVGKQTNTPVALGNYYADNVQLKWVSNPKLPVRIEK